MNQESKELMGSPKYLAKAYGNAELEWIEDARGKEMGRECPKRKKWAKEAREQWNGSRRPEVA